jgi:hypothetical protein
MIYCYMLQNTIMNRKDTDTNELMQQLEAENVIKDKWTMFIATHGDD